MPLVTFQILQGPVTSQMDCVTRASNRSSYGTSAVSVEKGICPVITHAQNPGLISGLRRDSGKPLKLRSS